MDGVRKRRNQTAGTIMLKSAPLATAAVAVLPRLATWNANAGSFDGLRRVAQNMATVASPELATAEVNDALPDTHGQRFSLFAITSLAAIPMLAAASIIGGRFYFADRSNQADASTKAVPITAAQPVSPNNQAVAAPALAAESQSMQQIIDNFGLTSTYSLYVKDLNTGQLAVANPDRVFESASLYKLFVANGIYQKIDSGQLHYTDQAGGDTGNTIAGCLNLMITISDNGCGQALGGLQDWSALTQQMRAQGYTGTNLNDEITYSTPRDVAILFQRLYAGSLLSADSSSQFLSLLKAQKVNDRLPQGLPAGTTFAHKTGDLDGFMHDAGIVYGPKTDYLVVMMGAPGANPNDFASLSQRLYAFFNK